VTRFSETAEPSSEYGPLANPGDGPLFCLVPSAAVHHGQAKKRHAEGQRVLNSAYAATPERFVRPPPTAPDLPTAVWINKPNPEEAAH
jgi:hypothetical protein